MFVAKNIFLWYLLIIFCLKNARTPSLNVFFFYLRLFLHNVIKVVIIIEPPYNNKWNLMASVRNDNESHNKNIPKTKTLRLIQVIVFRGIECTTEKKAGKLHYR